MTLILSGMVNICQLVANIPTFLLIDKVGRRKLAIVGGFAMAVPHIIMAGIVGKYYSSWETHPGIGWFGVALICKSLSSTFFTFTKVLNIDSRRLCTRLCCNLWTVSLDIAS